MAETTGEALRSWRGESSFEDVASAAGVSANTVRNWEAGNGEPRVIQALRLERWRPGLIVKLERVARRPR